jgi:RNA polymerase sigma factor (sigma-70 family)
MDEVLELCRRVLGASPLAEAAAEQARAERHRARVPKLAAAIKACRARADSVETAGFEDPDDAPHEELARAVQRELTAATAKLPERHREVLALRELLGLSHKEIARAMHASQATIPLLLARARLGLQAERRGTSAEEDCDDRERSLRLLALRQDGERVQPADQQWLFEHMADCGGCATAHAVMLEASVNYRAWRPAPAPEPPAEEEPSESGTDVSAVPAESTAAAQPEPEVEAAAEPEPEPQPEPQPEPPVEAVPKPQPEVVPEPEPKPQPEVVPEPEPEPDVVTDIEADTEPEP